MARQHRGGPAGPEPLVFPLQHPQEKTKTFNWFFFVETHFAGKSSPSAPGALGIGPVPPPCRGQMLADPGHAWYRWGQPAPAAPDRPWHRGGGCPRPAASPAPGVSVRGVRLSVLLEQKKRSLELKFRRRFYTQSPALCQGRPWGTDTSTKPPQSTGAARCPYCCPDWRSWLSRQPWVLYLGSFLLMLT